jgi:hypothetical protein
MPLLDRRSAASCGAMAGIYFRLLQHIAASPATVLNRRMSLSTKEKAMVAARSLAATVVRPPRPRAPGSSRPATGAAQPQAPGRTPRGREAPQGCPDAEDQPREASDAPAREASK